MKGLERHELTTRLGTFIAEDTWVSWRLMVELRRITPLEPPEEAVEQAARALLGPRFVGRKETYELFGLVDYSPAVQADRWQKLGRIVTKLEGLQNREQFVLLDVPHASLSKLRPILPKGMIPEAHREETWADEPIQGGPLLFRSDIVPDDTTRMSGKMLFTYEETPHLVELTYYNLVVHLLGLDLHLDDERVRCQSCKRDKFSMVLRHSLGLRGRRPEEKRDLGRIEVWGPRNESDIYFRGMERFE
jgi:hypothetical protein